MKICHVSVGLIKTKDPKRWLNSISYYTKILDATANLHEVISFHYCGVTQTIQRNGVTYKFLRSDNFERFWLTTLIATVNAEQADVVIFHGLHSSLSVFKFVRGVKHARVYIQHHGERVLTGLKAFLQKRCDKYIRGYLFSSAETGREWVAAGLIKNSEKVFEVLEVTSPFEPDWQQQIVKNQMTFLWVGRIDRNKDPETLLDGFMTFVVKYPNSKLFIISQDDVRLETLRQRISGFEKSISFVGPVPHDQMQNWYGKANFIISTSMFEAGGVSVLEAMSLGCIPVLTTIPSFRTITNNGSVGILFQPESPASLATALIKAAGQDILKERQKVVVHFNENLSAQAIASKIDGIIRFSQGKEKSSPSP